MSFRSHITHIITVHNSDTTTNIAKMLIPLCRLCPPTQLPNRVLRRTGHPVQSAYLLPFVSDQHCEGGQRSRFAGRILGAGGRRHRGGAQAAPVQLVRRHQAVRLQQRHDRPVQEEAAGTH